MPTFPFSCYLCGCDTYRIRPGRVRDRNDLIPLECCGCGLVALSSFCHITEQFYEDSHMQDALPCSDTLLQAQSAEDSQRRLDQFSSLIRNKRLLDFGCGNGSFLKLAKAMAREADGLEPDRRYQTVFASNGLRVFSLLEELQPPYDVITLFHVLEHLPDPLPVLRSLRKTMSKDGLMIVEVPSACDALLTLYESNAFSLFTYWSCHLFLHTPHTLPRLMENAGYKTVEMQQFQRYPLANHLAWLAFGKPGGHVYWPGSRKFQTCYPGKHIKESPMNNPDLVQAYAKALAQMNACDTIIGLFQPA